MDTPSCVDLIEAHCKRPVCCAAKWPAFVHTISKSSGFRTHRFWRHKLATAGTVRSASVQQHVGGSMAESALAPLRVKPYARISRAESRADENPEPSIRNPIRNPWARMSRFGHYATRPLLRIAPMTFGAGL